MNSKQFCRIDNLIIEKYKDGLKIKSLKRFEKENKVKLDLNTVPYISLGSRIEDNRFAARLLGSEITQQFEDLPIVYPSFKTFN